MALVAFKVSMRYVGKLQPSLFYAQKSRRHQCVNCRLSMVMENMCGNFIVSGSSVDLSILMRMKIHGVIEGNKRNHIPLKGSA